jgi:hypothetical protein
MKIIIRIFVVFSVQKNEYDINQCVLWGKILNTSIDIDYNIGAACTVCVNDVINLDGFEETNSYWVKITP